MRMCVLLFLEVFLYICLSLIVVEFMVCFLDFLVIVYFFFVGFGVERVFLVVFVV